MFWSINYSADEVVLAVFRPIQVESVVVNDGSANRSHVTSMTVTFSGEVREEVLNEAFVITNLESGLNVGNIHVAVATINDKTIATLTFSGDSTDDFEQLNTPGASLLDGNYRLVILRNSVIEAISNRPMDSDFVFGRSDTGAADTDAFFRMFGDTDGDRDVDGVDLGRFGASYLGIEGDARYDASFDFDSDGDVDGRDQQEMLRRLMRRL